MDPHTGTGHPVESTGGQGNPAAYKLPRPLLHSGDLDFSFAGLKTAVLVQTKKLMAGQPTAQGIAAARILQSACRGVHGQTSGKRDSDRGVNAGLAGRWLHPQSGMGSPARLSAANPIARH